MRGIYRIWNTINGYSYVGRSIRNLQTRRWSEHRHALVRGDHKNPHLQSAWNTYGADAFVFEILEEVPDDQPLAPREQYWKDYFAPLLYNLDEIYPDALHADETKQRMATTRRRIYDDPEYKARHRASLQTPEYRARRAGMTRQMWADPEYREKHRASMERARNAPDASLKRSEGQRRRWENPDHYEKGVEALHRIRDDPDYEHKQRDGTQKAQTPELIENRAAHHRKLWADPEYRKKRDAIAQDPEMRAKISKAARERWAAMSPEAQEAQIQRIREAKERKFRKS